MKLLLPALLAVMFPLSSFAQDSSYDSEGTTSNSTSGARSATVTDDQETEEPISGAPTVSTETRSATTQSLNPDGSVREEADEEVMTSTSTPAMAPAMEAPAAPAQRAEQAPAMGEKPAAASVVEAKPDIAGDLRAPSPKIFDKNRRGYFQAGVGPAYGAAMHSDSAMYNIIGSYNFNLSDVVTAKAFADIYLATGGIASRLMNYGVGAEYYLSDYKVLGGSPYLAADAGLGFGRNAREDEGTGLTLGAGAGFKFQANNLNFDINAHYTQMLAEVGSATPALFAVRGSVAF